ncbi:MAG: hypothetical protein WCA32_02825, partial [Chromatiaceae bacterium]
SMIGVSIAAGISAVGTVVTGTMMTIDDTACFPELRNYSATTSLPFPEKPYTEQGALNGEGAMLTLKSRHYVATAHDPGWSGW